MQIQLALDFGSLNENIEIAREVKSQIDIIEIGTPLIYRYGVGAVTAMRQHFPDHIILFDGKIVDAGGEEAEIAFEAGADIVTVLATADDQTILGAVREAKKYNKKVYVDLIGEKNIAARAKEVMQLGIQYIGIHTAHDTQNGNYSFDSEFKALEGIVPSEMLAVAGGINPELASKIAKYRPGVVIVGTAVAKAKDRIGMLQAVRQNLEG